jgi:hypothetical protein
VSVGAAPWDGVLAGRVHPSGRVVTAHCCPECCPVLPSAAHGCPLPPFGGLTWACNDQQIVLWADGAPPVQVADYERLLRPLAVQHGCHARVGVDLRAGHGGGGHVGRWLAAGVGWRGSWQAEARLDARMPPAPLPPWLLIHARHLHATRLHWRLAGQGPAWAGGGWQGKGPRLGWRRLAGQGPAWAGGGGRRRRTALTWLLLVAAPSSSTKRFVMRQKRSCSAHSAWRCVMAACWACLLCSRAPSAWAGWVAGHRHIEGGGGSCCTPT